MWRWGFNAEVREATVSILQRSQRSKGCRTWRLRKFPKSFLERNCSTISLTFRKPDRKHSHHSHTCSNLNSKSSVVFLPLHQIFFSCAAFRAMTDARPRSFLRAFKY
jgi:hypothetical protein